MNDRVRNALELHQISEKDREQAKKDIRDAINLLRTMVNSGEEHTRQSANAIDRAMMAVEKL